MQPANRMGGEGDFGVTPAKGNIWMVIFGFGNGGNRGDEGQRLRVVLKRKAAVDGRAALGE